MNGYLARSLNSVSAGNQLQPPLRLALPILFVLVGLTSVCRTESFGPEAGRDRIATLFLQVALDPGLPPEGALPVNQIGVTIFLAEDSLELGNIPVDVNPSHDQWLIPLDLELPESEGLEQAIYVWVGLLNLDQTGPNSGVGSVEWSGSIAPFNVSAGGTYTMPVQDIWRGLFGNSAVTAISLDPIPQTEVGKQTQLRASLTTIDPVYPVRYYLVSLDPSVAVVDDNRYLTAIAPGSARIMAICGRVADTAMATVVSGSDTGPPLSPGPGEARRWLFTTGSARKGNRRTAYLWREEGIHPQPWEG